MCKESLSSLIQELSICRNNQFIINSLNKKRMKNQLVILKQVGRSLSFPNQHQNNLKHMFIYLYLPQILYSISIWRHPLQAGLNFSQRRQKTSKQNTAGRSSLHLYHSVIFDTFIAQSISLQVHYMFRLSIHFDFPCSNISSDT